VSFDEDECLAFLDVPVTSVTMPLAELGSAAVDAVIARVERKPARDVMVREPMNLLPRHSVSQPARQRALTEPGAGPGSVVPGADGPGRRP
jgi:LacI family transcriptional regulator